ncbi:protein-tyrosine phosphatase [Paenibacillus anaericanus]|uniref:tyrosine-protein phosphatase n=1 Tax=Paenibacillus anaericanus TaxID=170367 RepID=UPI00278AC769|nr:CpsB/CapC family capsule biosynthesis tyrosine phosphatase [Paenibacillus anaericanus]MDQ0086856.1 protein-tyrosine phosphatase [Paenibacillus anaericanus]
MIDIHTHILPGVDDGAEYWNDTLDMARAAVSEGITTIIATPHHANGRYFNSAVEVVEHTRYINEQLLALGVPVTILPGQEIRVHIDLLEAWSRAELLPLANSNYVLIEMPSSHIPKEMDELIHELKIMNLKPIIAHPERNAEVIENPQRLAALIQRGAFAQVTSHSLLGGFGRKIEKMSWSLCSSGLIHIVSSDAHHVQRRGFRLREAYDVINERMGEQWYNYFINNAQCIIEDKPFNSAPTSVSSKSVLRRILSYFS